MSGLDDHLAEIGAGSGSLTVALVVATLLGLRHASDTDHVAALSALVLGEDGAGVRRAGRLGLAWGAGHALTLLALGLPVVLAGNTLPGWAQRAAEATVAVLIVGLALRLLLRRRLRAPAPGRSPRAAFGIGLVHGAGGSAGVGILLAAGVHGTAGALAAVTLFAAGSAASMALISVAWSRLLVTGAIERRLELLVPALGAASLAFGCWYGLGAVG